MRISDWSSDVCSSELSHPYQPHTEKSTLFDLGRRAGRARHGGSKSAIGYLSGAPPPAQSTEQVDLRVGDAGVGEGERCLRLGEGTFGVEGLQSVDRALALLRAGEFPSGLGLVA